MKLCLNEVCNKEIVAKDYRTKYCSRSCAASINNVKYVKRVKPAKFCLFCSKVLIKQQIKYCSYACSASDQYETRIKKWLADEISASGKDFKLASWARNYLLKEAGWKCKCGWGEVNPKIGRPILTINHIDGNWKNNKRSNLEVLCYNCHSLTETFGSLNRGSISGRRNYAGTRLTT